MFAGFAALLILGAFPIQLLCCFRAKSRVIRRLPTMISLWGELLCLAGYGISVWMEQSGKGIYGAAFAAVIYGFVFLAVLIGTAAAWLVWVIIKLVQKRRK